MRVHGGLLEYLTVVLIGLYALPPCQAAVTNWRTMNCDIDLYNDLTLDDLYSNALAMATYAAERMDFLNDGTRVAPLSDRAKVADNLKYMFPLDYTPKEKLSNDAITVINNVKSVFTRVKALMSGPDAGYIMCTDSPLIYDYVGQYYSTGVFYFTEDSENGEKDVIILESTKGSPSTKRPCSDGDEGITYFATKSKTTGPYKVTLIILCKDNFKTPKGTLTKEAAAPGDNPNVDDWRSAAGMILHEMVHALDPTQQSYLDQVSPRFAGKAYGYDKCYSLKEDPDDAYKNPDNYRILAEMCYMSETQWGAPKPPPPPA